MSLFSEHYYHRTIRKLRSAFGTLFNEIQLVRYNKDGTVELERKSVPIVYEQKEKYINRIMEDPNLTKSVQSNLPVISFVLDSLNLDYDRKINTLTSNRAPGTTGSLAVAPLFARIATERFSLKMIW